MPTDLQTELQEFQAFIAQHLRAGTEMSPEEALDLWRRENPDDALRAEDIKAVKAALRDMEHGDRGVPFEEFDREFRQSHRIPLDE
jgi:hypothetical protein